jgi:hypothetical protein
MTREEFIEILEEKGYSYKIEGDKIVINHKRWVDLRLLDSLPSDVVFRNEGYVELNSLTTLPPGIEFKNVGDLWLDSLTSLPSGMEFNNEGYVSLRSLTSISPGVGFKNEGGVYLESLIRGWIYTWTGNIEGIDSKMLLNVMIKRGLFI